MTDEPCFLRSGIEDIDKDKPVGELSNSNTDEKEKDILIEFIKESRKLIKNSIPLSLQCKKWDVL